MCMNDESLFTDGWTPFTDELKGKLNIDLNNLDRMTSEDLKSLVDCAVGQVRRDTLARS